MAARERVDDVLTLGVVLHLLPGALSAKVCVGLAPDASYETRWLNAEVADALLDCVTQTRACRCAQLLDVKSCRCRC